jgi:hypothetical protein
MSLFLKRTSLDWGLANALKYSDTNVFPKPFEFSAIQFGWEKIAEYLEKSNILKWNTRSHRTLLAPKPMWGFRQVTQCDPLDFIILTSIIYEIAQKIEHSRIAEAAQVVFSHRVGIDADGRFYSPASNYLAFLSKARELASSNPNGYVVITDITDFYPRLYHHRIETALHEVLGRGSGHVKALMQLLGDWNGTKSFGLPIGPKPLGLIAEVAIIDVDRYLLDEGCRYVRYVDDFRFICGSKTQALDILNKLANYLASQHGLSLNSSKTHVQDTTTFLHNHAYDPSEIIQFQIETQIQELIDYSGVDSWYDMGIVELTEDQRLEFERLDLVGRFEWVLQQTPVDIHLVNYLLARLGQIGDENLVDILVPNKDRFVSNLRNVVYYFANAIARRPHSAVLRRAARSFATLLMEDSCVASYPYNKIWLACLTRLAYPEIYPNEMVYLYNSITDDNCRRELILAIGAKGLSHKLKEIKESLHQFTPWMRRSIIFAMSAIPAEEYSHWIRGMPRQLDIVENAVAHWSLSNSIRRE